MNINTSDGTISFATGSIPAGDRIDEFLARMNLASPRQTLTNAGWRHVEADPEQGIRLTALFLDGRLQRVFISFSLPSDRVGEWTVQREQERKARHDEWLKESLGEPPYEFRWGSIASDYDSKGCSSDIIVTYEK